MSLTPMLSSDPTRPGAPGPQGPPPAPIQLGATLGRYVVLSLLGSGGMGSVYSAYDPTLDRRVAGKLVRGDITDPSELALTRSRLLREAQAMARLSHPNIITVHDVGIVDEQVFVAMEFIQGGTLRQWLCEREHPVAQVLEIFR